MVLFLGLTRRRILLSDEIELDGLNCWREAGEEEEDTEAEEEGGEREEGA